jgi:branched-chain amino acid transport system substrate-binding protein
MNVSSHSVSPRRTARRWRGAVFSVLVVLMPVALVACSSSGGSSSATSASTSAGSAAKLTGTLIKLAALIDVSGSLLPSQAATPPVIQAWVAATNATGGIAGHPVSVQVFDTKGDPATAESYAQQVVNTPSFAGAILVDAGAEGASAPVLSKGSVPVIGGVGYTPTVWNGLPNVFDLTRIPASFTTNDADLLAAKSVGAQVVANAICAEAAYCAASNVAFQNGAKAIGLTSAGAIPVPASSPSYTAQCLEFLQKKVDWLDLSTSNTVALKLAQQCTTQGFKGWFGLNEGAVTANVYTANPSFKFAGALFSFPWFVSNAPVAHYQNVMKAQGVPETDWAQANSTAVWATLELFAKTIAANNSLVGASGTWTRSDVIKAYGTIKNETLGGLLPQPLTFTANKPSPPVNCTFIYKYQGGQFSGSLTPVCPPGA